MNDILLKKITGKMKFGSAIGVRVQHNNVSWPQRGTVLTADNAVHKCMIQIRKNGQKGKFK